MITKEKNSQCALCRRAGKKLLLKGDRCNSPKCALVRREYAPGMHGASRRAPRQSDYSLQLREKQKAKAIYGLREKQFHLTFLKAEKKGNPGDGLLSLLETRLDNVVFRLGLASSRPAARQMVNHGHLLVDGQKVNIPSYQVKAGQEITIRKSSRVKKTFNNLEEKIKKANVPGWLNFDSKETKAKVLHQPTKDDLDKSVNSQMIVEFYSR